MIFYSAFAVIFTILFVVIKFHSKKNRRIPPGPIRWPILGCIPQMLMTGSKYPHIQLTALAKKYGNIMSLGLGVHYTIIISSYEMMKDVMKRTEANLDRYRFQFCDQRSNNKNLGILFASGDVWNEQRRYTVKHLKEFGFGKSRSIEDTMLIEMNCLHAGIIQDIELTNGIWKVDTARLKTVALNMMWSSVSGYRFDTTSEQFKYHLQLNSEIMEVVGFGNVLILFPFLRVFPKLSGYERIGQIHKKTQVFMKELVEDVKQKRAGRIEADSFVEVYLDEIEKNKNSLQPTMTEEQLLMILVDLFTGGSDVLSTAMNWILLYMAMYPKVQDKARNEILKWSKDGSEQISLTHKLKLPYIRAIILESLRHPPLASIPPARSLTEDIEYAGYIFSKGACLLYNLYPVFHNEEFWGDHDVYRPERFLVDDGVGSQLIPEKVERVCQFGFGGRICPGEGMSMDTLFMFLVSLLSTFSVMVVDGEELSSEPGTLAITLNPRPYSLKITSLIKQVK